MKPITDIARTLLPKFEACSQCDGGWVLESHKYGAGVVKRCQCWKAWQSKVDEALKAAKDK